MRRAALAAAALAGAAVGVVATMTLTDLADPDEAPGVERQVAPMTTQAPVEATTSTAFGDGAPVLLVWTSGGLVAGFVDAVAGLDGVESLTVVRGDEAALTGSTDAEGKPVDAPEAGWHIPLDALAVDPVGFASFQREDVADLVGSLSPGQALLTETSARLRRLAAGATVRFGDDELSVAGVIDDLAGAGAEVIVPAVDADRLGITTERYLLLSYKGDRDQLQRSIADLLGSRAVRFRSRAETTWMRHGDMVQPPAVIKSNYGEFAVRDRSGRDVEIDPRWVERWITTESVPILGSVTCHRLMIESLRAAMDELEQANLAHLVDASAFAGCYSARRIAAGQPMSRHAWGAALDLNVDGNPRGSFSTQDPRLVETMGRHGFTWGGTWLVPDPAHYEAAAPTP